MKVKHFLEKTGSERVELRIRYRKRGSNKYKLTDFEENRKELLEATVVTIYCEPEAVTVYCYERMKRSDHGRVRRK